MLNRERRTLTIPRKYRLNSLLEVLRNCLKEIFIIYIYSPNLIQKMTILVLKVLTELWALSCLEYLIECYVEISRIYIIVICTVLNIFYTSWYDSNRI